MKKTLLILVLILPTFFLQQNCFAQSQKLCIRKKLRVNNDRIKHGKALLVISDGACPRGTKELLNTAIFKGADGSNGANGTNGTAGINGIAPLLNLYTNYTSSPFVTNSTIITHIHSGGSFLKNSKSSVAKIAIGGTIRLTNDAILGAGYRLQIRMNNSDSTGSANDAFSKGISGSYVYHDPSLAANASSVQPFYITGIFANLNSGTFVPSLWASVIDAQQVNVNSASVGQVSIVIEEIEL